MWELDKGRQLVTPHDDMSQYLCAPAPVAPIDQRSVGMPARGDSSRGDLGRSETSRSGHEPMRPIADTARRETRPGRGLGPDPVRAGRDALLASLERPLEGAPEKRPAVRARGTAFDTDPDAPMEIPAVPSLAVLRPRRTASPTETEADDNGTPARKRAPSWDDVLFGSAPAARESS
jgi:hypothetical protein